MKKTDFLNYVSNVIDSKDYAYYDEQDQEFYFYHQHFTFYLKSNPDGAFLLLEEGKGTEKISETISLTYEETINFMEKLLTLIPTNHNDYQDKKEALGLEYFNSCIHLLDEYLRNYNPQQDIEQFSQDYFLKDYVLKFPLDGINHLCRIGQTSTYHGKKEHLLTSVVKIPFFLLDSNEPKSACIPYDLIIPSWKIKEYPILENFVEPNLFGTDFDETFQKMIKKFSHGKELYKEVLECAMPEKNIKTKSPKI